MSFDGAKLGAAIVVMVRDFVAQQLSAVSDTTAALAARLEVLEKREPLMGPAGKDGESIQGPSGPAGKDADPEVMQGMVNLAVAAAWNAMPKPQDGAPGRDGKDGEPGPMGPASAVTVDDFNPLLKRLVDEAFASLPIPVPKDGSPGKDGASVTLEDVEPLIHANVAAAVIKAVAGIPTPKDGERGIDGINGRDALQIEVLPAVDPAKNYARNTYSLHAGGLIRAFRDTDAINLAQIEKSGWETVLNGVAEEAEVMLDDGRTIRRSTVYTNGQRFDREYKTAALQYHGVWTEGEYRRGDLVTWGGSMWHCEAEVTTDKPETSAAWKLAVKKGRDGKV